MTREKGPDEMFCRSCGEPIKKAAEICPHCGVRNTAQRSTATGNTTGTTTTSGGGSVDYTTSVSENWYYGVIGALAGWLAVFAFSAVGVDGGAVTGMLVLGSWILMPIAIYFDCQFVRANSDWNPNIALWVVGSIIWLLNIVLGAVYLYRRHETMGKP